MTAPADPKALAEIVAFADQISAATPPKGVDYAVRLKAAAFLRTLTARLAEVERERDEAWAKSDAEMLRVKACEHIAEGDEGWQHVRNECPSTAAVVALRDAFEAAVRDLAAAREAALRYGAHDADCLLNQHTEMECKCGWHQARAALSPEKE